MGGHVNKKKCKKEVVYGVISFRFRGKDCCITDYENKANGLKGIQIGSIHLMPDENGNQLYLTDNNGKHFRYTMEWRREGKNFLKPFFSKKYGTEIMRHDLTEEEVEDIFAIIN